MQLSRPRTCLIFTSWDAGDGEALPTLRQSKEAFASKEAALCDASRVLNELGFGAELQTPSGQ